MDRFERSFVKNTDQRLDLNMPKLDGSDGKLFAAFTQENVEMYARVRKEELRASSAEESERRRAIAAEQAIDGMLLDSETWKLIDEMAKSDIVGKYVSTVELITDDGSYDFGLPDPSSNMMSPAIIGEEMVIICQTETNLKLYRNKYRWHPSNVTIGGVVYEDTIQTKIDKLSNSIYNLTIRINALENKQ